MSEQDRTIDALPARRVVRVVQDLAELRRRSPSGGEIVPLVTLHFRSGRELVGHVLALEEQREGCAVSVRPVVRGRGPMPDVCYIDVTALEAITVHEAAAYAPYLSSGTVAGPLIPPSDGSPPPTKLGIERERVELAKTSPIPVEIDWSGLPTSGEALRGLRTLMLDLHSVLAELASDPLGRESLGRLKGARLRHGRETRVSVVADVLEVACQPELGSMGCPDRTALRTRIESAL